jgi:hypothetical protein
MWLQLATRRAKWLEPNSKTTPVAAPGEPRRTSTLVSGATVPDFTVTASLAIWNASPRFSGSGFTLQVRWAPAGAAQVGSPPPGAADAGLAARARARNRNRRGRGTRTSAGAATAATRSLPAGLRPRGATLPAPRKRHARACTRTAAPPRSAPRTRAGPSTPTGPPPPRSARALPPCRTGSPRHPPRAHTRRARTRGRPRPRPAGQTAREAMLPPSTRRPGREWRP